ncbi:MAG: excisionase family DNA-binding protein [Syntrophomonadales bacterium]|jgi:excisionase family DNA binding protein
MRNTMRAREAARFLGISYWKLLDMAKRGEIPHVRVGKLVLFRRNTLEGWLANQEAASVQ